MIDISRIEAHQYEIARGETAADDLVARAARDAAGQALPRESGFTVFP